MDKLLEKLGFEPKDVDYNDNKKFYYIGMYHIIERYSHTIGLMLRSFSHFLAWLHGKQKSVYHNIGLQNIAKHMIKPFKQKQISHSDKSKLLVMFESLFNVQEDKEAKTKGYTIPEYKDPVLQHLKVLAEAKPLKAEVVRKMGERKKIPCKQWRKARIRQHGGITYL